MRSLHIGSFGLAVVACFSGVLTAQVMPGPTWSSYYGTTANERPAWRAIERLPNGNVVVGGTSTPAPPTYDGLVACFDPSGTGSAQCLWSVSIATAGNDEVQGLCVTVGGDVLVCGHTNSSNLPTTPGCYQPALAGGYDAFVARLDGQTGAVLCLTYFGGVDGDYGRAVEVTSTGDIVITGTTYGALPVGLCPPYQTQPAGNGDTFIAVFDPTLTTLRARTYFGGPANEQAGCLTLHDDRPVVGGLTMGGVPTTPGALQPSFIGPTPQLWDGFVARFDPCLVTLEYSTHVAGGATDNVQAIEIAPGGLYALAGQTGPGSPMLLNMPPASYEGGPWDVFVALLDSSRTGAAQLVWSELYGGTGADGAYDLAVDSAGLITVAGFTSSGDLQVTAGAFQPTYRGGAEDAFVARLDPWSRTGAGDRLYVSYYGGSGRETALGVVLDPEGDACMVGSTNSPNFPVTPGACQATFGGSFDFWVAELPLLASGITRISGAPACPEGVVAGVNSRPVANNTSFTLFATEAPASALGGVVLGLPGTPPFAVLPGFNVCPLADLNAVLGVVVTTADAQGFATFPLPIPALPPPPYGIAAQWAFFGTPPELVASPALVF